MPTVRSEDDAEQSDGVRPPIALAEKVCSMDESPSGVPAAPVVDGIEAPSAEVATAGESTRPEIPSVVHSPVGHFPLTEAATSTETAPAAERPRDIRVYRPSDVPFDPRRLELPDDFYAPTTADVKKSFASLSGTTQSLNNAPLMTKKMRDAEQAKKMSRFRKVLIRVRLPDRTAVQGTFTPSSTIREVVKFVNGALRNPKAVKFNLFVTPPKTILKDLDATLWSQGLVPAALINLGVESGPSDSASLLSDEALGFLEDAPAPGVATTSATAPPVAAHSTGKGAISGRSKAAPAGASKKVPSWLKGAKKK